MVGRRYAVWSGRRANGVIVTGRRVSHLTRGTSVTTRRRSQDAMVARVLDQTTATYRVEHSAPKEKPTGKLFRNTRHRCDDRGEEPLRVGLPLPLLARRESTLTCSDCRLPPVTGRSEIHRRRASTSSEYSFPLHSWWRSSSPTSNQPKFQKPRGMPVRAHAVGANPTVIRVFTAAIFP